MDFNYRVISYKEVSNELGKLLIKLYGVKIFPRQGKIFADMLFQTGIEAGTYIASLADIEERNMKINLASNAMIKLNQTSYLIGVMREAGYYDAVDVVEMEEYMDGLLRAMRELLTNAFAQLRSERGGARAVSLQAVKPQSPTAHGRFTFTQKPQSTFISAPKPAINPAPQPALQSAPKQDVPPRTVINIDPDGFNSIISPFEDEDGFGEIMTDDTADSGANPTVEDAAEQKPDGDGDGNK